MTLLRARYADGQALDVGDLTVRLKVSARARRISLRIDRTRGEAIAVAPSAARLADAADFARERHAWIARRLAERRVATPALAHTDRVEVFGIPWRLEPDGRRPTLDDAPPGEARRLRGCGAGAVDAQLVIRAIRREAAAVFEARARVHCAALGAPAPPITLNDARTRWGSCTPAQRGRPASIRLSWRLALAPFAVADYVVAHECAHLLEANHGPRFWALVRGLVGDEARHRAWLRARGPALHATLPRAAGV